MTLNLKTAINDGREKYKSSSDFALADIMSKAGHRPPMTLTPITSNVGSNWG